MLAAIKNSTSYVNCLCNLNDTTAKFNQHFNESDHLDNVAYILLNEGENDFIAQLYLEIRSTFEFCQIVWILPLLGYIEKLGWTQTRKDRSGD